ncbi:unnamed protein product [Adineta steineri]|uniref:Tetratricopeptide repeat protein n=1 Tax=Adineta steineri TaxID=433720 RepID=A0A815D4Z4_9BILA|nr:unnamed protein product [Adineta steineri]CAF1292973.1 unnamed protein product [Adineta steineri]
MSKSKSTLSATNPASSTTDSIRNTALQEPARRILQNFLLVWLDANFDEINKDLKKSLDRVRRVIPFIKTFTDAQECIDFLSKIKREKIFMIVSGSLGQTVIPEIEHLPQLDSVYVYCGNEEFHKKWAQKISKIKGVYSNIEPIRNALKINRENCDRETTKISFNGIDPIFMYTQLLKQTILEIEDDDKESMKELAEYCRFQKIIDEEQIDKMEHEYYDHTPIWWYTAPYFIYSMLNAGLREMDIDIILKMNFFIRHLHNDIDKLHDEQQASSKNTTPFPVYRGQGLSLENFDKMQQNNKGGLMSFNNFLSTSLNRETSLEFARAPVLKKDSDMVGILFVMTIDPVVCAKSSIPYADVKDVGFFKATEAEILFTTHSVFRIDHIKKISDTQTDRLWEVRLTLVGKENNEMNELTKHLGKEISGETGWSRLGDILRRLRESEKCEQLYNLLLEKATTDQQRTEYYNQLGRLYCDMNENLKALSSYEQAIAISKKNFDIPLMANIYSNIGEVYRQMGEYSMALSKFNTSIELKETFLPSDDPSFAPTYNNLGLVYASIEEYATALSYYEKDLEISKKILPPNHPDLAVSYCNIGDTYLRMEEYSKALLYYELSLEIRKIALPPNHRYLASSYCGIAHAYNAMNEYSKAIQAYERQLEIEKINIPSDHPDLAIPLTNLGFIYMSMFKFSKALYYYEKAYQIDKKTLSPDHPRLSRTIQAIGILEKAVVIHPESDPIGSEDESKDV